MAAVSVYITLPPVKSELAACDYPPFFVICCWFFFFFWGNGPLGMLFLWAACSRNLQRWQKSFTVKSTVCFLPCFHTNHSCSFTFPVLVRCCSEVKVFRQTMVGFGCVCVCVPKLSREHVKKSCGQRMLLLPVGFRELHTERRDELIQWKSRLRASRVNISRGIC